MTDLADVLRIYLGSNGDATKALYAQLEALGSAGIVAVNLFRACKASERAKVYRRGYSGMAYDKKQWSMDNLCRVLVAESAALGIGFGWGVDPKAIGFEHVLYVDLPTGQVSFHTDRRGAGRDYPGEWDGQAGQSAERICRWCAELLQQRTGKAA